MSAVARVLGIDPGPAGEYGVALLYTYPDVLPFVTVPAYHAVDELIADVQLVALERFVIGHGTVKRTRGGTDATLETIAHVRAVCDRTGTRLLELPAGIVKPWATDERLGEWGLLRVRGGHHRDATRHALFAAVRTGLLPRNPRGLVVV